MTAANKAERDLKAALERMTSDVGYGHMATDCHRYEAAFADGRIIAAAYKGDPGRDKRIAAECRHIIEFDGSNGRCGGLALRILALIGER